MRSRTELVTTTFDLDSDEEDYSPDDDDSEEDWRPNKKRQQKQSRANGNGSNEPGRRKRRTTGSSASKSKRRAIATKVSDDDFESADDDADDDDEVDTEHSDVEDVECPAASTSFTKRPPSLQHKKLFVKPEQLDLLINKRELFAKDWLQSSRLCLWRKDEQTKLLQKYLRVRISQDSDKPEEQQLQFTSSSVYSSWDEQHISDFVAVKANCLDPNKRRIQLADLEAIKKLSIELQEAEEQHTTVSNTETAKSQLDSKLKDEDDNDDNDDDDDDDRVVG